MERKKKNQTAESKTGCSARANYNPTWRVKGNPICITRRAITVTRLRYLHYKYSPFLPSFRLLLFCRSLGAVDQAGPAGALYVREIYIYQDR